MSFVLDKALEAKLTKLLPNVDKDVVRVSAEVSPAHTGEDWLYFRVAVALEHDAALAMAPDAYGKRLQRISTALRERAARLNVPMFVSVAFVADSEASSVRDSGRDSGRDAGRGAKRKSA